jgi:two-component system sensor histidine kinase RegB
MSDALLATQSALAREQKLTDLGGVVAAAAHELGTPLATIKLISGELLIDFPEGSEAHNDIRTIRAEADRCRDIMRSMGRAGKDDTLLRRAPLETVVREAAEPHMNRGKTLRIEVNPATDSPNRQPIIERRPEIIHGLRNLIQNAVDFAQTSVMVELGWTTTTITLRIADDGQGFPQSVIGLIGTPFMRRRKQAEDRSARPGYDGMGLGLFIAKTLLERSGARLAFSNGGGRIVGGDGPGAIVVVTWPRSVVDPVLKDGGAPLGENRPFLP